MSKIEIKEIDLEIKDTSLKVDFKLLKLTRDVMDYIALKYLAEGKYTFSDELGGVGINDFYSIDSVVARNFTLIGESDLKIYHEGDYLVYLPDYNTWFPADPSSVS